MSFQTLEQPPTANELHATTEASPDSFMIIDPVTGGELFTLPPAVGISMLAVTGIAVAVAAVRRGVALADLAAELAEEPLQKLKRRFREK